MRFPAKALDRVIEALLAPKTVRVPRFPFDTVLQWGLSTLCHADFNVENLTAHSYDRTAVFQESTRILASNRLSFRLQSLQSLGDPTEGIGFATLIACATHPLHLLRAK